MKPHVNHLKSAACILGVLLLVGCETNKPTAETATTQPQAVSPQQVPIPTTAAEVPGPAPGPMTKSYVETVGRVAYLWGWPLVYVYNQRTALTHVPHLVSSPAPFPLHR